MGSISQTFWLARRIWKQMFQVRRQLNLYTFLLIWPTSFLTHNKACVRCKIRYFLRQWGSFQMVFNQIYPFSRKIFELSHDVPWYRQTPLNERGESCLPRCQHYRNKRQWMFLFLLTSNCPIFIINLYYIIHCSSF